MRRTCTKRPGKFRCTRCFTQWVPKKRETLGLTEEEWVTFAAVKEKFTAHFVYPLNEACESVRFHRRVQEPGESVDSFYTALRELVRNCHYSFAEVKDRLVSDRFVVGLLYPHLSDRLCLCPNLNMAKARLQARIPGDAVKARATIFREGTVPVPSKQLKVDATRLKKGQ